MRLQRTAAGATHAGDLIVLGREKAVGGSGGFAWNPLGPFDRDSHRVI